MTIKKLIGFLTIIFLVSLVVPKNLETATLSSVKNTLSSSRLSYVGAVGSGNTAGGTLLTIKTSSLEGWATSDDNLNLFTGDSLMIGSTSPYTVVDVFGTDQIQIYRSGGLGADDVDVDDPVIATRSAQHTLTFTPITVIEDGRYRIRIKATGGTQAQSKDGIPDADGFDFTESFQTSYIDCTSADSGSASIVYSGDTNCPTGYTCAFCTYTGNNTLAAKSINVGTTAAAQQPINPSPSSTSKSAGEADIYTFYVDHMEDDYDVIDSTPAKIAVIESVRVTAVVDPTIEFEINGVNVGQTACDNALDVTSTATTVPFGSVAISTFTDLAQELIVSTNADDGYAVTAIESDQLALIMGTGLDPAIDIDDTLGDTGDCEYNDYDEWSTTSTKGFGYSLEKINASATVPFEYDTSGSGCTGTFCAKQFADNNAGETAQTIFNSGTVADSENVYVCYRVIVSETQEAGTYTNAITYVASATF